MQSLPELFEVGASTTSTVSSLFVLGRSLNYFPELPEKYSLVNSADVARVARESLHPNNLVVVAVGDRAKIEQELRDANIGDIEVRTVGGKVIEEHAPAQP
jgi:zinc protease